MIVLPIELWQKTKKNLWENVDFSKVTTNPPLPTLWCHICYVPHAIYTSICCLRDVFLPLSALVSYSLLLWFYNTVYVICYIYGLLTGWFLLFLSFWNSLSYLYVFFSSIRIFKIQLSSSSKTLAWILNIRTSFKFMKIYERMEFLLIIHENDAFLYSNIIRSLYRFNFFIEVLYIIY